MAWIKTIIQACKCSFGWCGGEVISATHEGRVWVAWQCAQCKAIKHQGPA